MIDEVAELFNVIEERRRADAGPRFDLVKASSVVPLQINWIWRGRLPSGKFVVFDGPPGVGKTTVMMDLISRATRGIPMPGSDDAVEPMTVIVAGSEDDLADTMRPRLDAAGADLERVLFVKPRSGELFTLPMDTSELGDRITETGAKWVHIETIMGVLDGSVNTNSDKEVRRALAPLIDMASERDILITCIRHPRKNGATSAVAAGGGSTAFSAIARVVMFAGFDHSGEAPSVGQRPRVLAVAKSNLGVMPASLNYKLVSTGNGHARVEWSGETHVTADELASAPMQPLRLRTAEEPTGGKAPSAAERFLLSILVDGITVPVKNIEVLAEEAGIPWRTVQRAAKTLGVVPKRSGFQGSSSWTLDTDEHDLTPVAPSAPAVADDQGRGATGATGINESISTAAAPDATPTRVEPEVTNTENKWRRPVGH